MPYKHFWKLTVHFSRLIYADAARIGIRNARLSVACPADPDLPNGQRGARLAKCSFRPHFASAGRSGDQDLPGERLRDGRF